MPIIFFDVEPWEEKRLPGTIGSEKVHIEPAHVSGRMSPEAAAARVISIFSWSRVTAEILQRFSRLEHIATRSTGVDHIDIEACRARGVAVSHVPLYGERTVAEHTFALILALSRKILHAYDRTRRGNFSREGLRGFDLQGKTLFVVGCGKIGAQVALIARAFAMNVIVFDRVKNRALRQAGVEYVATLKEGLERANVISLHVPLTPATRHLINMETIQYIRPQALLINTARGDVVQTAAVLRALDTGILAGVGLDVLENERLIHEEAEIMSGATPSNQELATMLHSHVLLQRPEVLVTPHNAFNSEEAIAKILGTTISNIEGWLAGKPRNLVSGETESGNAPAVSSSPRHAQMV